MSCLPEFTSLALSTLLLCAGCPRPPLPPSGTAASGGDDESSSAEGDESSDASSSDGDGDGDDDTDTLEDDTDTDANDFVPGQDGLEQWSCDPWNQDCPEGEKCVPYASTGETWNSHKCVPVMGAQPPGEPCVHDGLVLATDDCDETSLCFELEEVDGQLVGTCRAFCAGSPDFPECADPPGCPSANCLIVEGLFNMCIPSCDPLVQDCGPGEACYWDGQGFTCAFTNPAPPRGWACGFINDCPEGSVCVVASLVGGCEGDKCCTSFCDLDAGEDPCPDIKLGTSCQIFEEAAGDACMVGICRAS